MSNDMRGLILKKNPSPAVGLDVGKHLVVGQYSPPTAFISVHPYPFAPQLAFQLALSSLRHKTLVLRKTPPFPPQVFAWGWLSTLSHPSNYTSTVAYFIVKVMMLIWTSEIF